jgi:hypothetical protein
MPHGAMFDQQAITSRPPGIFNFSIYGCSTKGGRVFRANFSFIFSSIKKRRRPKGRKNVTLKL